MGQERVIAVANGKGGVGKTSLVANLAGEFAASGLRVLVVDLDVSANLALNLGLVGHERNDQGRGVYDAIMAGHGLPIVAKVREGIDWVPGGQCLNWLLPVKLIGEQEMIEGGVDARWRQLLAEAAQDYDIVLLDCPPGSRWLQEMALASARWILLPVDSDAASIEGLKLLGPLVKQARETNPDLEWMGWVLFAHPTSATRVLQTVKDSMAGHKLTMFNTFIRASKRTAQECRKRGLLVRELAAQVATTEERITALRAHHKNPHVPIPPALPETSTSLASDYASLAEELAELIQQAELP